MLEKRAQGELKPLVGLTPLPRP